MHNQLTARPGSIVVSRKKDEYVVLTSAKESAVMLAPKIRS